MNNYNDEPSHQELVEQAEAVKQAVEASTYIPIAHGEAEKLIQMLEEKKHDVPARPNYIWIVERDNGAEHYYKSYIMAFEEATGISYGEYIQHPEMYQDDGDDSELTDTIKVMYT